MITKELVDRINWLARKQRSGGLTDEEKEEQHRLRQQYLQGIRSQVTDALDSMGLKPKKPHKKECSCHTCSGNNDVIH
ncbi:MAG: DUF896 domain-containing protein [Bacillota bacterium]